MEFPMKLSRCIKIGSSNIQLASYLLDNKHGVERYKYDYENC